jgi:GntR family transcriptional regulator, transcriptional repressor for pyruvate dehydrogenase complex
MLYDSIEIIGQMPEGGSLKASDDSSGERKLFQTIPRAVSLVERADQQLESLILNGSLPAGELLPTERKLGEMLGVSRTVVRETIRLLAAKGLVQVTSGSGTYVRSVGPNIIYDSVNLLLRANRLRPEEIYEVRNVLEITVAGLAAERATTEDILAMEGEISILKQENLQAAEYARHDFLFHTCLAEATRNPLFLALINSISTVTIRTMSQMYAVGRHEKENRRLRTEEHSAIVECVTQHDCEGARKAMARHMTESLNRLREAQRFNAAREPDTSPELE